MCLCACRLGRHTNGVTTAACITCTPAHLVTLQPRQRQPRHSSNTSPKTAGCILRARPMCPSVHLANNHRSTAHSTQQNSTTIGVHVQAQHSVRTTCTGSGVLCTARVGAQPCDCSCPVRAPTSELDKTSNTDARFQAFRRAAPTHAITRASVNARGSAASACTNASHEGASTSAAPKSRGCHARNADIHRRSSRFSISSRRLKAPMTLASSRYLAMARGSTRT